MATKRPALTLYQVLGVSRNARLPEIVRAYSRLKAEEEREDVAPDPQRHGMAQVAHDTLTDPDKRAEYDKSLGLLGQPKAAPRKRKGRGGLVGFALVAIAAAAGAAWYFVMRPATGPAPPPAAAVTPQQIADEVGQHVGRVQGALMSGEVRELGAAVGIASGEMVTTCRGIEPGMQLSVKSGEVDAKAEVARANADLDLCTLAVKGAGAGVKLRPGVPAPSEKLHAITVASAKPGVLGVSVVRAIQNPAGPVLEIKAGAPLANGTPLFDSQARLVGIVVTPHTFDGVVVAALGAARIAQSRNVVGAVAAAPSQPATQAAASPGAAAEPREDKAASPPAAPGTGNRGKMVGEGFSTLWKEDDDTHQFVEPLDNVTKGQLGVPHAYWTKWTGRDAARPHLVHCLVTTGSEESVVADYDQDGSEFAADGYYFCAITRWQVDLERIPVGIYTFTIFVDGSQVAQNSLYIEKRFFTRGTWAVIVIVAGLGLLTFVRRRKAANREG